MLFSKCTIKGPSTNCDVRYDIVYKTKLSLLGKYEELGLSLVITKRIPSSANFLRRGGWAVVAQVHHNEDSYRDPCSRLVAKLQISRQSGHDDLLSMFVPDDESSSLGCKQNSPFPTATRQAKLRS